MTISIKNGALIAAMALLCAFGYAAFAHAAGSNGSFENGTDPGSYSILAAGDSTSITGWTVGGNGVDYIGTYWQASNGTRSIDLNEVAPGSVSQTIATVPGATYTVTFDLSGNPDSAAPNDPNFSPSTKVVQVTASNGGAPQAYSYDTAAQGNDKTNMKWQPKTYTFVATGNSSVLTFASQTQGAFGPAIDNVQIAEAVPQACTPGTLTLVSDGNTTYKGMTTTDPAGSSAANLFTGGPSAAVVAGPDGFPGAWDTAGNDPALSGASWVNNTSTAPGNPPTAGGDGTVNTWRLFARSFSLPAGAIISSANVSFSADNSANAFYDNASIGSVPDYKTVTTVPFGATAGNHELEFVTKNDAYTGATNPTAVIYKATINYTCQPTTPPVQPKVVIAKYIDGVHATAANANNAAFPMVTTFTSSGTNGNAANAPYTLSPTPWGPVGPYEAEYTNGQAGDNYATNEVTSGNDVVGASCADGKPFALVGYTTGDTMAAAAAATPSATVPSFTNLQKDEYVIVWNKTCPQYVQVHITKYVDGVHATAAHANNASFQMQATYSGTSQELGQINGTNPYDLNSAGNYEATTLHFVKGFNYGTSENMNSVVGATCAAGTPFAVDGYKYATTLAGAQSAATSTTAPNFPNMQSDEYVIVLNKTCPPPVTTGSISGMKYNDLNHNGKKDANEPGLQGWTIRLLLDGPNDTDTLIATTTTDANGNYTFSNVAPGTYDVRETHQKGWKRYSKNPKDIVVVAGSSATDINFGNAQIKKGEKEDTDQDDNRDDQGGKYYCQPGHNDYEQDQNDFNHTFGKPNVPTPGFLLNNWNQNH